MLLIVDMLIICWSSVDYCWLLWIVNHLRYLDLFSLTMPTTLYQMASNSQGWGPLLLSHITHITARTLPGRVWSSTRKNHGKVGLPKCCWNLLNFTCFVGGVHVFFKFIYKYMYIYLFIIYLFQVEWKMSFFVTATFELQLYPQRDTWPRHRSTTCPVVLHGFRMWTGCGLVDMLTVKWVNMS